jgi:hypothetical protein
MLIAFLFPCGSSRCRLWLSIQDFASGWRILSREWFAEALRLTLGGLIYQTADFACPFGAPAGTVWHCQAASCSANSLCFVLYPYCFIKIRPAPGSSSRPSGAFRPVRLSSISAAQSFALAGRYADTRHMFFLHYSRPWQDAAYS